MDCRFPWIVTLLLLSFDPRIALATRMKRMHYVCSSFCSLPKTPSSSLAPYTIPSEKKCCSTLKQFTFLTMRGGANSGNISSFREISAWWHLFFAVSLDMAGTALMKQSHGMQPDKWPFTCGAMILYIIAYACFGLALHIIPVSVCYAYFQAFGTVLASIVGVLVFRESFSFFKIGCLAFIVIGVVGLEFFS